MGYHNINMSDNLYIHSVTKARKRKGKNMGPTPPAEMPEGAELVTIDNDVKLTPAQYEKLIKMLNYRINRSVAMKNKKAKVRAKNKNARKERRRQRKAGK